MPSAEVTLRYRPSKRKYAKDAEIEKHLQRLVDERLVIIAPADIKRAAKKRQPVSLRAKDKGTVEYVHRRTANKSLGKMVCA